MKQSILFSKQKIRYMKNSLLINNEVLVFGDLHIGYEDEIVREGIIPNMQIKEVFDDLNEIFERLDSERVELKEIVLLGDLKQEFGVISDSEWRDVLKLIDYLKKKCEKLVVLKGNHDLKLEPIVKKRGIVLRDYYKINIKRDLYNDKILGQADEGSYNSLEVTNLYNNKIYESQISEESGSVESSKDVRISANNSKSGGGERNIWFLHGDKLFKQVFRQCLNKQASDKNSKLKQTVRQRFRQINKKASKKDILILGHLHPAISLSDDYKKEKYKCFLCGNSKGFIVYILPSFSSMGYGYDLSLCGESYGGKVKTNSKKSKRGSKVKNRMFDFIIPNKDLMKFKVIIYDNENKRELKFGKLGKLIN